MPKNSINQDFCNINCLKIKFSKGNKEFKGISRNFQLNKGGRGEKLVKYCVHQLYCLCTHFTASCLLDMPVVTRARESASDCPQIAVQQGIMRSSFRFDWLTRPGQSARTSKNKYEYDRQMLEHGNALKWQSIALWPISAHIKDTWPSRSSVASLPRPPLANAQCVSTFRSAAYCA